MQAKVHRNDGSGEAAHAAGLNRLVAVLTAATLGLVGLLAAVAIAHGATRSSATVAFHKTPLGMVLVAANGHTLYLFEKDRHDKSACVSSCATFWPPLIAHGKPTAGTGVKGSLLGTTRRPNGSMQVTYNKHPLYSYVADKRAGQTNGESVSAFGAKWYALSTRGVAVLRPPVSTTTSTTTTNPYPYP